MQELILLPEEESIGERADKYLAVQLPQYSRSFFQKLFKDDQIQIQNTPIKASYRITGEEEIALTIPDAQKPDIVPENIPLDILYEDEDILIVNKPKVRCAMLCRSLSVVNFAMSFACFFKFLDFFLKRIDFLRLPMENLAVTPLLVEEPPRRTQLHLTRHRSVVERIGHRGQHFEIFRIQVIQNGFGQRAARLEPVEETVSRFGAGLIADGVVAGIGAEPAEHPGVRIADRPDVELLRPPLFAVHHGQFEQQTALQLRDFLRMERAAAAHFIENATQVVFGIIVRREGIHPVIGKAASRRCEAVVPPTQRVQQLSIRADRNVRRLFEPCEVSVVVRRIGYGQRPVGTPRRQHPDGKIAGSQLAVVFQRIDRIVGRTDRPNVAPPHQRLRRKRVGRQRGVAGVVNFTRRSDSTRSIPNSRASSRCVQWYNGFRIVYGTVSAHFPNFS